EEAVGRLSVHPPEPRAVVPRRAPGARHHDEPEPPGGEGSADGDERLRGEPALGAGDPDPAHALRRPARARVAGAREDATGTDRAGREHRARPAREGRRRAVSRRERRAPPVRPHAAPIAKPAGFVAPAPPLWRDRWALVTALGVVPLLVRSIGAPLGEPVAEDFDFLRRSLFGGMGTLLDGGGSTAFWRP